MFLYPSSEVLNLDGARKINVGDILSAVGDIMSTVGDILSTVGDILSTVGDTQYHGDIMMHVGGYREYLEGVQYREGTIFCYLSTLKVLNTSHSTQNTPTVLVISPHGKYMWGIS